MVDVDEQVVGAERGGVDIGHPEHVRPAIAVQHHRAHQPVASVGVSAATASGTKMCSR